MVELEVGACRGDEAWHLRLSASLISTVDYYCYSSSPSILIHTYVVSLCFGRLSPSMITVQLQVSADAVFHETGDAFVPTAYGQLGHPIIHQRQTCHAM